MDHLVSLSGGNALGAFLAGAVQEMTARGIAPRHVAGTSIGAITAALWMGGPPDQAVDRLTAFWQRAADKTGAGHSSAWRKGAVARALMLGRPELFRHRFPGLMSVFPGAMPDDHVFDTAPLHRFLAELVDLDHLNASPTRVSVVALDQATGESVVFDNHHGGLRIDHILASASLPLAFPPVRLGGRHLVDAGLSENCPVRRLFDPAPTAPAHCWVIDPWPRQAPLAHSLDEVLGRTQDLAFGCQRDWALRDVAHRLAAPDAPQVALHEIIHDEQAWEIGAKAFDYAPAAVERRWSAGRLRMAQALDAADGALGGASTASTGTAPG